MTPYIISLDFETRSACDLINEGAYRYATDQTTEVICCSYRLSNGNVWSWVPPWVAAIIGERAEPPWYYAQSATYQAWNSQFDRLIWQYVCTNEYDWPDIEIDDWICTASLARSNGLPGKLEDAAKALGIVQQKDARGKELIKLLSIPTGGTRYAPEYNNDPALLAEMVDYCEQDVRTEYGMSQTLRPFLPHELKEFHASERINDRGIAFDISFARRAVGFSELEMAVLETRLQKATNDTVERPTQYQRVKQWLLHGYVESYDEHGVRYHPDPFDQQRISEEALRLITVYKKGERKICLDKAVRNNLLELYEEDPTILTEDALEVVQLTDLAGRSSTAKYKKMVLREVDGRLPGAFMFAGAKSTGRFSSTGVQIHNLVRDCVENFDEALEALHNMADTEVIHTLAKMMRPTFTAAPGKLLYWSDWSNVEGRALPYLANDRRGDEKLELFAYLDEHPDEPDIYERMAERLRVRGKDPRQGGKVIELSFGFGGGIGACHAMSRNYGVRFSDTEAKGFQQGWRAANPWAEPFWYGLKDAAWNAVATPGQMFKAGRVTYFYTPNTHNGLGTLWCQLPSKRLLSYVAPRFERVACPWDESQTMVELTAIKANFKPKAGEKDWPRYKLWYGVLAENVTQAFCADLLRAALVRFEEDEAGCIDIVGHTHDEAVAESDTDISKRMQRIMETLPPFVEPGFPLKADIKKGFRYSK